jgi:hypothetical protein
MHNKSSYISYSITHTTLKHCIVWCNMWYVTTFSCSTMRETHRRMVQKLVVHRKMIQLSEIHPFLPHNNFTLISLNVKNWEAPCSLMMLCEERLSDWGPNFNLSILCSVQQRLFFSHCTWLWGTGQHGESCYITS